MDEPALHGDVSGELVEAGAEERYALERGVSYDQPTAYGDNPDPEYPATLLPKALGAAVVTIRIVVDGEGSVRDRARRRNQRTPVQELIEWQAPHIR